MKANRDAAAGFLVEFESEGELRDEYSANLTFGALRIPTVETFAIDTAVLVTLRGPWGGETTVRAQVVAALPDGLALSFDGNADEVLAELLTRRTTAQPRISEIPQDDTPESNQNAWDRVRGLSQMEKILLAVKADRTERAMLIQDNDPRVLLSVLRNPRLTVDEVVRLAKSSFLTYQIADVIMKTGQWMGNGDVRIALIHNAKTPVAFALRILPMLPESEVRAIARGGTSMELKQAALRRLQNKK